MSASLLTEQQRDALQEIANIGMGRAGDSIARVLGCFVQLTVPRVLVLLPDLLSPTLASIVGQCEISAVRQAFHGELCGEAIAIFDGKGCGDLAELMGYDTILDDATEKELLLDVSNVLVGACMRGIAEQLDSHIGFSAPEPFRPGGTAATLFATDSARSDRALFVEVSFRLEHRSFACRLIILLPQHEIERVRAGVDAFLGAYA